MLKIKIVTKLQYMKLITESTRWDTKPINWRMLKKIKIKRSKTTFNVIKNNNVIYSVRVLVAENATRCI